MLLPGLFFATTLLLRAQSPSTPYLERKVTLAVVKQPVEKILNQISDQTGCVFSYSTESVNVQNVATVRVVSKPVKIVLNDIFDDEVSYKSRGKYIILKKRKANRQSLETTILEGYVYDRGTGRQVTQASVYDKHLMLSAITDQYGYFRIEVPRNQQISNLFVSKAGYTDTLLVSTTLNSSRRILEVALNADRQHQQVKPSRKFPPQWLLPAKLQIHTANLTDSLFRKMQWSLLPMVNTNSLLTGNTQNDFSFNLTVGYVYAIRKCEVGAIVNIVRTNAGVCQLAGVGNIVGGVSSGFQGAGAFNVANSSAGVQASGAINVSLDKAPVQVSGAVNVARKSGMQWAGVINLAQDSGGYQFGGAVNIAGGNKMQISGSVNLSDNSDVQITGGVNLAAGRVTTQIAGGVNVASIANVQISPVNIASRVKGMQLGVINIADSCSGIPIGFFNYVRSGYHRWEVSMDEASFVTVAFRSGVNKFHTAFEAGFATKQTEDQIFVWGYGVGSSFGNARKTLFDIDLSMRQFATPGRMLTDGHQFKLYSGVDMRIARHFSLAVGASYNVLVNKTDSESQQRVFGQIAPYSLSDKVFYGNTAVRSWIGGKVALRFL